MRTIRAGRDAWQAVNRAESFDGWKAIGAALAVGKRHALKVTGANAAWGQHYSREFGKWMEANGFTRMLTPSRRGGRRYRSDKGSDLFIRYRMSAAGELHLVTATANALPI